MAKEINRQLLLLMLDDVADVPETVTKHLKAISDNAVENLFFPVPAGVAPLAMPAEVYLTTVVLAFMATLDYGM